MSIKNKLGAKADTPKNFKWISSGSTLSASSSWWAKDFSNSPDGSGYCMSYRSVPKGFDDNYCDQKLYALCQVEANSIETPEGYTSDNCQFYGNDIRFVENTANILECYYLCQKEPDCNAFTLDKPTPNKCYLQSFPGNPPQIKTEPNNNHLCGIVLRTVKPSIKHFNFFFFGYIF